MSEHYGENHEKCNTPPFSAHTCLHATTMLESTNPFKQFLHVSGGYGNTKQGPEVHLQFQNSDGKIFQGWFMVEELMNALAEHEDGKKTVGTVKEGTWPL